MSAFGAAEMRTSTAPSWSMRGDSKFAGVKPQCVQRFRRNRFYKSAMHAAVQYPDLAMLMWEGGSTASDDGLGILLPGSKQVLMPRHTCEKTYPPAAGGGAAASSCLTAMIADTNAPPGMLAQAAFSRSQVSYQ